MTELFLQKNWGVPGCLRGTPFVFVLTIVYATQYDADMKESDQDAFQKNFANLSLELRRGTLVLSVLSQLRKPQYGYSLVEELGTKGIQAEPGTLYPLLRRLEAQQLLDSMWETSGSKPRKYYVLTDNGRHMLDLLLQEWQTITRHMIGLLKEE